MSTTDVVAEVSAWLEANWDPDLTVAEWWERLGTSGWAVQTEGMAMASPARFRAMIWRRSVMGGLAVGMEGGTPGSAGVTPFGEADRGDREALERGFGQAAGQVFGQAGGAG